MVDRIKLFSYVVNEYKPEWGVGHVLSKSKTGTLTVAFIKARFKKNFRNASFIVKVDPYHLPGKGKTKERTRCGLKDDRIVSSSGELKPGNFLCPSCQLNKERGQLPEFPDRASKRDPTVQELTRKDIRKLMTGPKRQALWQTISAKYFWD